MLIKRTERQARRGSACAPRWPVKRAAVSTAAPSCAAPALLPAASPRSARCRSPACARRKPAAPSAPAPRIAQEHLHALLGRLHGDRRSVERRVDRAGAGLGQPDQSRLALRQRRRDARTGARRPPPALSDEDGQRPVDADFLGRRDQRDRRQAAGDPREVRRRIRSTGSARPSSPTKAPISIASSRRSGAPTTPTTRRASAIRPRSPA